MAIVGAFDLRHEALTRRAALALAGLPAIGERGNAQLKQSSTPRRPCNTSSVTRSARPDP